MLKIAICDDDPVQLEHAAAMTKQELVSFSPEIKTFISPYGLLSAIKEEQYSPDIALLDIVLENANGIDFAASLNELLPSCRIIFLTAYPEYASEVYRTDHIWFVTKDRAEEYLGRALKKAASFTEVDLPRPGLVIKVDRSSVFIPSDEILYLSREGRKAIIVTENGRYYSSRSPAALTGGELAPLFVHCHQGYWVNLRKIASLEHDSFTLTNGEKVPISRTCREEARSRFFAMYRL